MAVFNNVYIDRLKTAHLPLSANDEPLPDNQSTLDNISNLEQDWIRIRLPLIDDDSLLSTNDDSISTVTPTQKNIFRRTRHGHQLRSTFNCFCI